MAKGERRMRSEEEIRKLRDELRKIKSVTEREDLKATYDLLDDCLSWILQEKEWELAKILLG